jgi:hypothetical protein
LQRVEERLDFAASFKRSNLGALAKRKPLAGLVEATCPKRQDRGKA